MAAIEELVIGGEVLSLGVLGTLIYLHHKSQEELFKTFWLSAICLTLFYSFALLNDGLKIDAMTNSESYTELVITILAYTFLIAMLFSLFHLIAMIFNWFMEGAHKLFGLRKPERMS